MEKSYGLVVYRITDDGSYEYLIVHPSGSYNRKAPFYIPKGGLEKGEAPQEAALRETQEETGLTAEIEKYLGTIEYKNKRKKIEAWLAKYQEGEIDEQGHCPNHDWENDIVRFVPYEEALELLREEIKELIIKANNYLIEN